MKRESPFQLVPGLSCDGVADKDCGIGRRNLATMRRAWSQAPLESPPIRGNVESMARGVPFELEHGRVERALLAAITDDGIVGKR